MEKIEDFIRSSQEDLMRCSLEIIREIKKRTEIDLLISYCVLGPGLRIDSHTGEVSPGFLQELCKRYSSSSNEMGKERITLYLCEKEELIAHSPLRVALGCLDGCCGVSTISLLDVDISMRTKGIGLLMVLLCLNLAKMSNYSMAVCSDVGTPGSIDRITKLGFNPVSRFKNSRSNNDVVFYTKIL